MALTKCPECKKKVSDTCHVCIHCGYKLKIDETPHLLDELPEYYSTDFELPREERNRTLAGILIAGIVLCILLALAAVVLLVYVLCTHAQRPLSDNEFLASVALVTFPISNALAAWFLHLLNTRT